MIHKTCGGVVTEDWNRTYEYEDDDGSTSRVPSVRCEKCKQEIISDRQIVLTDEIIKVLGLK